MDVWSGSLDLQYSYGSESPRLTSLQEVKEVPLIQRVRICESESAVDSCMMSLPGSLDLWICYGYGSESARVCRKFH